MWQEILQTIDTFLNLLENDTGIDNCSWTSAFVVRVVAEGPFLRPSQYALP